MKIFSILLIFSLFFVRANAQWNSTNFPLPEENIYDVLFIDNYIIASSAYPGGIIYRTSDLGNNWQPAVTGIKGTVARKLFANKEIGSTTIFAATDSGLFNSTNYGDSWNDLTSELPYKFINSVYVTGSYIFLSVQNTVSRGLSRNYRSTDSGLTWEDMYIEFYNQSALDFIRYNNTLLACMEASDTTVYKSEDFGLTWVATNGINLGYSGFSSFEVLNERIFYLTYGALYQSTDGGNNWERIGPFTWYPSDIKKYGDYLFISSLIPQMYLIHSDSTGISNFPGDIPFQFAVIDVNAGMIVASGVDNTSFAYDIWTRTINDITSAEEFETSLQTFTLNQNYPNPFNPTTKISWQSSVSSWQTLKIFDVLGNEIATLVDEYKAAGVYKIEFNAERLSSGIYFYQLQTNTFSETKKMMLIK